MAMFFEDFFFPQRFHHRGKRYRLRAAGSRSLALLRDVARNPKYQSGSHLLRLRPRIRRVLAAPAPVSLAFVVDRTRYDRAIRLAIWMLGRIGNPYGIPSVLGHVDHPDFRVRREVIRALKRLHAWPHLLRIERTHADPRIRALAKADPPRPYSDRLAHFVATSRRVAPTCADRQLEVAPDVLIGSGRPPRSGWQIGKVLHRIRSLVRGAQRRRWFACWQRHRSL